MTFGTEILIIELIGIIAFAISGALVAMKNRKFFMDIVNFFDAVGLGVFAVTGTNTAIVNGHAENAFLAIFVGVVTGIGGGMIRDIMAGKIPARKL